jgi:hypothetical protein
MPLLRSEPNVSTTGTVIENVGRLEYSYPVGEVRRTLIGIDQMYKYPV